MFEVERESFCKAIRERELVDPFTGIAEIRKGEGLFLWMEIEAGERALTMLEARGQMPIYHAWASEKRVADIIDIGITKERWVELANAIKNQFKNQGFFTWRTQSFKRKFKRVFGMCRYWMPTKNLSANPTLDKKLSAQRLLLSLFPKTPCALRLTPDDKERRMKWLTTSRTHYKT